MSMIKDLVVRAKTEIVSEMHDTMVDEIKTRIREIRAARKTLDMLEMSYNQRLVEMEADLREQEIEDVQP